MHGVQFAIYSTRGVVSCLIKVSANYKLCTARPSAHINWLIITLSDLDRHDGKLTYGYRTL
jgi:hypothetical protein